MTGRHRRCRSRRWRGVERRLRPRLDQPRERPALHRHPHERARARHGRLRRRGARARSRSRRRCRPASRSSGAASSRARSARWRACALVVPVALLITLVLLFNAFGSFSPAVLVLLNVPFALVGGVVGLCAGRHAALGVGRGRLHRADRPGVAERRAGALGDPRAPPRGRAARRGHPRRLPRAPARRADDRRARRARPRCRRR